MLLSGYSSAGWCVCILVSINKAAQECLDTEGWFWLLIKHFVPSFLPFLLFTFEKNVHLLRVSERKGNCEAAGSGVL